MINTINSQKLWSYSVHKHKFKESGLQRSITSSLPLRLQHMPIYELENNEKVLVGCSSGCYNYKTEHAGHDQ